MPDYTDPWLLPYPGTEEYAAGAQDIEEMARAIEPVFVTQDARITALATRPTIIARRSADVAHTAGNAIVFDTVDHNNAGITVASDGFANIYSTPLPGAHPVGGLYPAIWRMNMNVFFTATAPVAGSSYAALCRIQTFNPTAAAVRTIAQPEVTEEETAAGAVAGVYLNLSFCAFLELPGQFRPFLFTPLNGTFKANSFFSLTRIRSV